jgi:hypothetical protein
MAVGDNVSGQDGKVNYGATPTEIKITNWDYTKEMDTKEVSDSGSTAGKDYIPDKLYSWSGTFTGWLKAGVTKPAFGEVIALELIADAAIESTGSAIITSQGTTLQVSGGDAVQVTYNFQGTGILTETDTTA